jgi:hypothetical protein
MGMLAGSWGMWSVSDGVDGGLPEALATGTPSTLFLFKEDCDRGKSQHDTFNRVASILLLSDAQSSSIVD